MEHVFGVLSVRLVVIAVWLMSACYATCHATSAGQWIYVRPARGITLWSWTWRCKNSKFKTSPDLNFDVEAVDIYKNYVKF